jgi:putative DNA primase/helicase
VYQQEDETASVSGNTGIRRAAERYMRSGVAVIPIPGGEKNPNRADWQKERWTVEDIPRIFDNDQNIGILLGEPSGGLVDVDLDWTEARIAARHILPETRTSGREGCPESHRWYYADPVPNTKAYKLSGKGDDKCVVELRSTGAQTLVAPSVHPEGGRYGWGSGDLDRTDGVRLAEGIADVATAALIARSWPGRGSRHDYALAATGYVGRHVPRARAERIMEAAIAASGDEESRARLGDVKSTLERIANGERATGGPTLDRLAPDLPDQLARWHGWRGERTREAVQENKQEHKQEQGITVDLAEAILAEHRFAQDPGGKLYVYEDGAYRAGGEKLVQRKVKALLFAWGLISKWSSYRASEVAKYILADAPTLWERPPLDRVSVLNGILDLETLTLSDHDPKWLSTVQIPVVFDPEAVCPAWEKQVAATFPEDARDLAWEILADLMQPDRSHQKAIILVGEGRNGKSVFLENAAAFIGRRNRVALSLHRIETDRFSAARLVGRLANICPDLPSTDLASTSMFKAIVGGDEITGEHKYGDAFDFQPFCRLIFSANHLPRSQDASHAFFARWIVIPFERTFEGAEQVPRRELDARLQDPGELSGVLNKALAALPRVRARGFTESVSMQEAWAEFRQTTDPLAVWLDRATISGPDAYVTKDDLINAYNRSAAADGRPVLTKKAMAQALHRLRPNVTDDQRTVNGKPKVRCWVGIGLKAPESPDPNGGGDTSGSEGDQHGGKDGAGSQHSQVSQDSSNCFEKVVVDGSGGVGEEEVVTHNNRKKPVKPVNPVTDPHAPTRAETGSEATGDADPTTNGTNETHGKEEVMAVLESPPAWLANQLKMCREDPDRWIKPTSSAVATAVYGTSTRWREVQPLLEAHAERSEGQGDDA